MELGFELGSFKKACTARIHIMTLDNSCEQPGKFAGVRFKTDVISPSISLENWTLLG